MDYQNAIVWAIKLYRDRHAIIALRLGKKEIKYVKMDSTGVRPATPADMKGSLIKVGKKFGMTLSTLKAFPSTPETFVPNLLSRLDRLERSNAMVVGPSVKVDVPVTVRTHDTETKLPEIKRSTPWGVDHIEPIDKPASPWATSPPPLEDDTSFHTPRSEFTNPSQRIFRNMEPDFIGAPVSLSSEYKRGSSPPPKWPPVAVTDDYVLTPRSRAELMGVVLEQAGSGLLPDLRTGPGPAERAYIAAHKSANVVGMIVYREPIRAGVDTALNWLTLGKWRKIKENLGFDQMYHLYCIVKLSDGANVKMERNQTVIITDAKHKDFKAIDERNVPITLPFTFERFLKNGEAAKKGSINWWQYSALRNNCQDFILSLVEGASATTADLTKFIKQDIGDLLPPYAEKLMKTITDVAGSADVLINGRGFEVNAHTIPIIREGLLKLQTS